MWYHFAIAGSGSQVSLSLTVPLVSQFQCLSSLCLVAVKLSFKRACQSAQTSDRENWFSDDLCAEYSQGGVGCQISITKPIISLHSEYSKASLRTECQHKIRWRTYKSWLPIAKFLSNGFLCKDECETFQTMNCKFRFGQTLIQSLKDIDWYLIRTGLLTSAFVFWIVVVSTFYIVLVSIIVSIFYIVVFCIMRGIASEGKWVSGEAIIH